MDKLTKIRLRLEDIIEERLKVEKRICDDIGRDISELIQGECTSCDRIYYKEYLSDKSECIPCWRESNDLPKIDEESVSE